MTNEQELTGSGLQKGGSCSSYITSRAGPSRRSRAASSSPSCSVQEPGHISALRLGVLLVQRVAQDLADAPPGVLGLNAITPEYTGYLGDPFGPNNPSGATVVVYLSDCSTLAPAFPVEHCDDASVLVPPSGR